MKKTESAIKNETQTNVCSCNGNKELLSKVNEILSLMKNNSNDNTKKTLSDLTLSELDLLERIIDKIVRKHIYPGSDSFYNQYSNKLNDISGKLSSEIFNRMLKIDFEN